MCDDDFGDEPEEKARYRESKVIDPRELGRALENLTFLGDDLFLRMQIMNLCAVDSFVMTLETQLLEKLVAEERTPIEAIFVSALSQMWIFAAYELMRTWRQRVKEIVKWSETGGLELKLEALQRDQGYHHSGRAIRAGQIERVLANPALIGKIREDLRRTHFVFARMEAIRVSIAKHEVSGRSKSVALRPGYGRINMWCGALDYELENGRYSIGSISRRDIADELRALPEGEPPSDETLAKFDEFMRGPTSPPPFE